MIIGDWDVNPTTGQISRNGETVRLEARTMRLLVYLAERAGEVVSIDELLKEVWAGVIVTSDSVYQAVASLRRELGDDTKQPTYIVTVPRLGYKMVAKVSDAPPAPVPTVPRRGGQFVVVIGVVICLALAAAYGIRGGGRAANSIAVVPFLDLTDGMSHEYFADGMTEEVIDKLSKEPGLRVAAPTTSFYLKRKPIAIVDIAKQLGVTYVLDGSVRKSHATYRVAARLSRGDNGLVVWSETYDRPSGDMLWIQDDIATQVTKAITQTAAR
ncbi:MAG TPA: winged helix-turn-helix domain-containing protein [Gemmatimonadaceae bacterium]|nr:winged helix-turn-helix domain-containing protein [Gemmatimonadaceae bacterium]